MKNKESSLSTDQRVDAFKRALGNIIRDLLGLSNTDLPSDLPRPVNPSVDIQKKGNQNDKLSHPH
jgi:hypothetical protein